VLLGRLFDRYGAPVGGNFEIHTERVTSTHVIGLRGGGFVVAFDSFGARVQFRTVSPSGVVGSVRNGPADMWSQAWSVVAAATESGFVLAWEDGRDRFGIDQFGGVYFRRFSSSGAAIDTEDRRAAADPLGREQSPWIAADGDDFVVAWTEADRDYVAHTQARRFRGASALDGADTDLGPVGSRGPMVTALHYPSSPAASGPGHFFVSWYQRGAEEGIHGRRFDIGGSPGEPVFVVSGEAGVVAPLPGSTTSDSEMVAIYHLVDEYFGADVVATSPLPMGLEALRAQLTWSEQAVSVVPAPEGLWFSFMTSQLATNDRLGLFFLPLPGLPLTPAP